MDFLTLKDKVVGGEGGEGVLIEDIAFKFDTDKAGDDLVYIELMGTAKTVLKDGYNPLAGYDDLPEALPVKDSVKIVVSEGKNADNQILFDRLNKAFGLEKPLVDSADVWERFTKEHEDSVYEAIVGKPAFFRVTLPAAKTGEKWGEFYTNLMAVAKREEASMPKVADKMAAIKKKRAEKEKAKKEAEAALAGSGEEIPF